MRIGASSSIASAGRFMQFVASVSITSTPSAPALAPLPPAINSPTTKREPSRRLPPNASTSNSPAEAAGAFPGRTGASAPTITPAMRLIVEVRALTGAGSSGLTRLPGGRRSEIGRKQPPLVGICRVGQCPHRPARGRQRPRGHAVERAAHLRARAGEVDLDRAVAAR